MKDGDYGTILIAVAPMGDFNRSVRCQTMAAVNVKHYGTVPNVVIISAVFCVWTRNLMDDKSNSFLKQK